MNGHLEGKSNQGNEKFGFKNYQMIKFSSEIEIFTSHSPHEKNDEMKARNLCRTIKSSKRTHGRN